MAATLVVVGVGGAEEHGADGGRRVELEARGGASTRSARWLGGGAGAVDEVGESVAAEGAQGDGDLQGVGAAGGAQRAAEEVGEAGVGVVVRR